MLNLKNIGRRFRPQKKINISAGSGFRVVGGCKRRSLTRGQRGTEVGSLRTGREEGKDEGRRLSFLLSDQKNSSQECGATRTGKTLDLTGKKSDLAERGLKGLFLESLR